MRNCYPFVYLDESAINYLYPQIFDDSVERSMTRSSEDNLDSSVKSNLLNMLGSDISSNQNSTISQSVTFATSTARKAQLLIDHFQADTSSLLDIISGNHPHENSICVVEKSPFSLCDIHSDCSHYTCDDHSLATISRGSRYDITMNMPNSKIEEGLLYLIRGTRRTMDFVFSVFGTLIKYGEQHYAILPFAVWT